MHCLFYPASDIDECSEDRDDCHDNATCTNTNGGYNCACFVGYMGDGVNCIRKHLLAIIIITGTVIIIFEGGPKNNDLYSIPL